MMAPAEDGAQGHGQACYLRYQSIAHDVGKEDALVRDSSEFSIGDIVFSHDIGDKGPHAQKPAAEPNEHQTGCRQD